MNLQQGAYGPPTDLHSLVLFWEVMEKEHYPMASIVKKQLQEQLERQTNAMTNAAAGMQLDPMMANGESGGMPVDTAQGGETV